MRQKRAKTYRKLMSLYSMSFGFRQPYQVLVDSEICKASVDHKIELAKQLGTVTQGEIKPMITQCCIHELYLQRGQQPAVDLAKTFERRKCNHREPIPGDDCVASVVGDSNKHRYVIATQSNPLRSKLRSIPAVPVVHINRSVMILEPASDTTMRAKALMEQQALTSTSSTEKAILNSSSTSEPPPKKKRGPKGPNPLSVKKKKVSDSLPANKVKADQRPKEKRVAIEADNEGDADGSRKRKRPAGEEGHGAELNVVEGESSTGSRKRKRRRKGTSSSIANVNSHSEE
ncbi:Fcf1-domain-containing protein [Rhodocollybia butyracea]|uniref:U three protein 23 n=1 Tax=Rhodocollybia butyracea TaxID=206335 RepID=A0A9P5U6J0_9AGAR|nr:Fcf1-domain-containing protein [Rhodocollybia butyracea]